MLVLLTQLDYVAFFEIEKNKVFAEDKLGDIIWNEMERTEDVIYEDSTVSVLDSLLKPLCEANAIERDSLKVHIVKK